MRVTYTTHGIKMLQESMFWNQWLQYFLFQYFNYLPTTSFSVVRKDKEIAKLQEEADALKQEQTW